MKKKIWYSTLASLAISIPPLLQFGTLVNVDLPLRENGLGDSFDNYMIGQFVLEV